LRTKREQLGFLGVALYGTHKGWVGVRGGIGQGGGVHAAP
jgi:hypothetical protein